MLILALNTTLEDCKMHNPAETNLVLQVWFQLSTWLITCKLRLAKLIGDWNRIIINQNMKLVNAGTYQKPHYYPLHDYIYQWSMNLHESIACQ